MTEPILRLRGITKHFGGVKALTDVSLDLEPGKVVALVGDNGAGKSTLVKVMAGVHRPDSGEYLFEGRKVEGATPASVADMGVQTVYQDLALCNNLDAVQNLFLGRELTGPWWTGFRVIRASAEKKAKDVLRRMRLDSISLSRNVGAMSGGQRQNIAIARSILWEPKVVLLDEPAPVVADHRVAERPVHESVVERHARFDVVATQLHSAKNFRQTFEVVSSAAWIILRSTNNALSLPAP